MLLQNIQHLPPVLGLSDYFEILFQGKQAAKSVAEDRMVVRDHDPDLGLRCGPRPGRSIRARIILRHTLSVRNCTHGSAFSPTPPPLTENSSTTHVDNLYVNIVAYSRKVLGR